MGGSEGDEGKIPMGSKIQAAIRAIPGGFTSLINTLKTEEGRISQVALLAALQRLEADALKVLNSWQAVAASIAAAHAVVRRSQRLQSRFSFVDPDAPTRLSLVPAESSRSPPGHLPATAKQPMSAQQAGESISVSMLISKLQEADTAALSKLYSQVLDLLLPAFSLFPEKEYMVVLRPSCSGSSAACPLLTYFQLVSRKSCSTLQHCLYILHRQSFMEPLLVNFSGRAGPQSEDSISLCSLDDGRTQERQAAFSSQVLVCLSGDRVIGLACVSEYNAKELLALQKSHPLSLHTLHKTAKLQQQVRGLREKLLNEQRKKHRMQCRFDALPPLPYEGFLIALEARATAGNVLLEHFAINPIFTQLQSVILREVMRCDQPYND
ncbi:hypothetical protein ACSSS7_006461 [Eimeria intestinalis]